MEDRSDLLHLLQMCSSGSDREALCVVRNVISLLDVLPESHRAASKALLNRQLDICYAHSIWSTFALLFTIERSFDKTDCPFGSVFLRIL